MRDLAILKERGYPVEADRGRGGGVRLNQMWGVGRLLLSYRELIDLLLSLAIMEKIGSPFLLSHVRSIRHKIANSFPDGQRALVNAFRKRILIGEQASRIVLENYRPPGLTRTMDTLIQGFFESKLLDLVYVDEKQSRTERCIEPHYLFLNWPVWYVIAWDHLRHDVRVFRLDRMIHLGLRKESFKKRADEILLKGIEPFGTHL